MNTFETMTDESKKGQVVGTVLVAKKGGGLALTPIPIIYNGTVNDRPEWQLVNPIEHYDEILQVKLIAPAGYTFDLASIPKVLWSIIAPFELSILAPLFHDSIYELKGHMDESHCVPISELTRSDADGLFLRLMQLEGITRWKRNAAYAAVRAAGSLYWDN